MSISEILMAFGMIIVLSYVFDIFSSKTKLPSVVLLLLLGAGIKWAATVAGVDVAFYQGQINSVLPLLGTLGLILIVLEGSLDLQVNHEKMSLLRRSFTAALVILLATVGGIWLVMWLVFRQDCYLSLLNAVPLGVISSAIAIPSVKTFGRYEREFVVYESSFSDILGVILFNFMLNNPILNGFSVLHLGRELLLVSLISVGSIITLGYLFERLGQHKKFILLLAVLLLFYGIAKSLHLSALVLIFVFGLFAGNSDFFIKNLLKQQFHLKKLEQELHGFQSFTAEIAFVIRTLFFVVFGASIDGAGLLDGQNLLVAGALALVIGLARFVFFKITKDDRDNLFWFVAPRGLITLLLYLSIPEPLRLPLLNQYVLVLIILASIVILASGSLLQGKKHDG